MKNRPAYAIESVDRALRLATLLQHEGSVRVIDAAEALSISASGAHRLLAMLVYRDFAEQLPDRSYGPGPALRTAASSGEGAHTVRRIAPPHLQGLVERTGESANVMVRVGTETRFVATVESDRALRVGDRSGRTFPAHLTSGGKALLAALGAGELADLYVGTSIDVPRLHRSLQRVRHDGYAINRGETEEGVTAIGMVVPGPSEPPTCAISVGLPSSRFRPGAVPQLVAELTTTRDTLAAELNA